jgi:anaerobic selenocysteine-containing dehydrogenase
MKLKPGDTVRVIGSRGTAKIRAVLTDVHGALRVRRARLPSSLVMPPGSESEFGRDL